MSAAKKSKICLVYDWTSNEVTFKLWVNTCDIVFPLGTTKIQTSTIYKTDCCLDFYSPSMPIRHLIKMGFMRFFLSSMITLDVTQRVDLNELSSHILEPRLWSGSG